MHIDRQYLHTFCNDLWVHSAHVLTVSGCPKACESEARSDNLTGSVLSEPVSHEELQKEIEAAAAEAAAAEQPDAAAEQQGCASSRPAEDQAQVERSLQRSQELGLTDLARQNAQRALSAEGAAAQDIEVQLGVLLYSFFTCFSATQQNCWQVVCFCQECCRCLQSQAALEAHDLGEFAAGAHCSLPGVFPHLECLQLLDICVVAGWSIYEVKCHAWTSPSFPLPASSSHLQHMNGCTGR